MASAANLNSYGHHRLMSDRAEQSNAPVSQPDDEETERLALAAADAIHRLIAERNAFSCLAFSFPIWEELSYRTEDRISILCRSAAPHTLVCDAVYSRVSNC